MLFRSEKLAINSSAQDTRADEFVALIDESAARIAIAVINSCEIMPPIAPAAINLAVATPPIAVPAIYLHGFTTNSSAPVFGADGFWRLIRPSKGQFCIVISQIGQIFRL